MASDIYKIIMNTHKSRSSKKLDERTRDFLSQEESDYHKKGSNVLSDVEFDTELGVEKDATNHLQDIEKISFRELNDKPVKDQLKILKNAYQVIYDKCIYLNNISVSSEKVISNMMIEKRQEEKKMKEIRRLLRLIATSFPGNSELKEMVDTGSWTPKQVEPLFVEAAERIVQRLQNQTFLIEEALQEVKNENLSLKQNILIYRDAIRKIDIIQNNNSDNERTVSQVEENDIANDDNMSKDIPSEDRTIVNEKENVTPSEKPEEYQAYFGDFHKSNFLSKYEELKKEGKNSSSSEANKNIQPEDKQTSTSQNSNNKVDPSKLNSESSHPLSPDFVETEKESVLELFDDNIKDYVNNLSSNQEFILGVIGRTGLSRNPDIRDYLSKEKGTNKIYMKGNSFDYQALSSDVSVLRDKDILLDDKVAIGGSSGGSSMIIYELSDKGKQCFKYIFKDDPVIAEKRRMLQIHASLEHGYLIKDSAKVFRELGMTVVTDLEKVTFKLDSNTRKVFDYLVVDKDNKTLHIEVERGTHTKEGFYNALDKIYKITKEFYFITPNEDVKNKKVKQLFFSWITDNLGGIENADVIFNITTIDTLRKKPKHIWTTTDLRNISK